MGVAYIYIYIYIFFCINIDHTTADGGNPRAVDMENVIFSNMGFMDNRWLAGFQPSTVGGQVKSWTFLELGATKRRDAIK